jgi:MbtH protein
MANPFDAADSEFLVLRNLDNQHSLWPLFLDIPDGWVKIFGPSLKMDCLEFIENSWKDIRPLRIPSKT